MRALRFGLPAAVLAAVLLAAPSAQAQGTVELGFHYGYWSVNLLKSVIEGLADDFIGQIKEKQLDRIRADHPELREIGFRNDFSIDSGGPDFGFELRWYPGGEKGSFSLGLCVEKTTLRIGIPRVSTSLTLEDERTRLQGSFEASGGATMTSKPLAFLLTFRWDILPAFRIHPYLSFGLGMAGESAMLEATMDYHFEGTLSKPDGTSETIREAGTKTVQQLMDEDRQRKIDERSGEKPFSLPINILPFVQLHFGLKGVITKNLHALVDFGILNGFLLRGGLALRI